jgi:hypothetical protein
MVPVVLLSVFSGRNPFPLPWANQILFEKHLTERGIPKTDTCFRKFRTPLSLQYMRINLLSPSSEIWMSPFSTLSPVISETCGEKFLQTLLVF